ncbi:MAG TPA: M56 family metallopeptidase, partial [Kiritimatiellia bacterium]
MNINLLQRAAESFGGWLVETSLHASVLILFVLLLQAVFRKRLAPRWKYALWLLVVARLCMPAVPSSPVSVFNVSKGWKNPGEIFQGLEVSKKTWSAQAELAPSPSKQSFDAQGGSSASAFQGRTVLFAVWFIVAAGLLVRMGLGNYRLSSRVCRQRPVTRQDVLDVLEDCKQELGVHIPVNVVESEHVASPALLGFVRPRLLLPQRMTASFERAELRLVFLHELAHLKRSDILVNWIVSFLHVLHWFNPLVWVAFYRLRADRELATDSLVLSSGREQERERYGETMIKLLEFSAGPSLVPGVVGILEDKGELKRRMTMIAGITKGAYGWSALAAGLMVALGLTTLTGAKAADVAVAQGAQNLNLDFEQGQAGWGGGGEGYALTVDDAVKHGGKFAGKIRSLQAGSQGFGSYTGTLQPSSVGGKRVRLSGWLKLENVTGAVSLWMRADKGGQPAAFETLQQQGINGTRDWKEYAIEIDIPEGTDNINFGALLAGGGTLWADDLRIETVGAAQVFDTKPAEEALGHWLGLIDGEQYGKSWEDSAPLFRSSVTREQWEMSLASLRKPMGKLEARKVTSSLHQTTAPGAPDGDYVIFQTETS